MNIRGYSIKKRTLLERGYYLNNNPVVELSGQEPIFIISSWIKRS